MGLGQLAARLFSGVKPEPTATLIPQEALEKAVDGLELPAGTHESYTPPLSCALYDIARNLERYIGEGSAYNRDKMDDGRFILVRAITDIGTACLDPAATEIEIDNKTLADFRSTLFQIGLLPKPAAIDHGVTIVPLHEAFSDFVPLSQQDQAKDVYRNLQKFAQQAETGLLPLLGKVSAPIRYTETYDEPFPGAGLKADEWF